VTAARLTVLAAAIAVMTIGIWRGTWAVGGSDSSCYALMAAAFAHGRLQPTTYIIDAPWPEASLTFAPGGFVPSPVRADAASPICTPGFSLLLAPLYVIGGRDAIFLLTPVAGGLLVWLTFLLGRELAGPGAGVAAALVVAATPVLVFQPSSSGPTSPPLPSWSRRGVSPAASGVSWCSRVRPRLLR
jgi:hypothetical protein